MVESAEEFVSRTVAVAGEIRDTLFYAPDMRITLKNNINNNKVYEEEQNSKLYVIVSTNCGRITAIIIFLIY